MLIFISYQYLWVDKENSDAKKNQWSIINFLSNFRMGKTFPWKVLFRTKWMSWIGKVWEKKTISIIYFVLCLIVM